MTRHLLWIDRCLSALTGNHIHEDVRCDQTDDHGRYQDGKTHGDPYEPGLDCVPGVVRVVSVGLHRSRNVVGNIYQWLMLASWTWRRRHVLPHAPVSCS